jgi:hypothetical protein
MSLIHLEGCPKGRSESFGATSPTGEPLTVTRCIDCGADAVATGKALPESEAKPKGKPVAEPAALDAGAER